MDTKEESSKRNQPVLSEKPSVSRRNFMQTSALLAAGLGAVGSLVGCAACPRQTARAGRGGASDVPRSFVSATDVLSGSSVEWNPYHSFFIWGRPIRVQPILMYTVAMPQEMRSWKSWGDVLTDEAAAAEAAQISEELRAMQTQAEFPIECLPVVCVKTAEQAAQALQGAFDVVLVYAASGSGTLLQQCVPPDKDALLFVRHQSGAMYYWYEALSVAYLQTDRQPNRETRLGHVHVDDVVVDAYGDLLWRLRALYGVKNFMGSRIVALGGVWGKYAPDAPQIAADRFNMEIIDMGYDAFAGRIEAALRDPGQMLRAEEQARRYLALSKTELQTDFPFVVNAFVLYALFREVMREHNAPAFTIKECMSTIIPMAKTTACLALTLLNDEGLIAFCESDFVVVPPGVLLRHIAGKPVFMHNSTFPHDGIVTCAHCSAPRRMNADRYEPMRILTHEESEYGAAPKVEIPIGQEVCFIDPEYTAGRWVGLKGQVTDNPFYSICRSQQEVRVEGDWQTLKSEVRDSHWLMVYGDYLDEIGYAARKLGIVWDRIS
ncbi:MAG: sugar isomerase [bacterium]|jgi:L-fucose isomerase-like protein|nr:sugar isomerase [bacterium]